MPVAFCNNKTNNFIECGNLSKAYNKNIKVQKAARQ